MKEDAMTDRLVTRRQVLVTGGAASLLLLAPDVLRSASAIAGTAAVSVGFVDTLDPLVPGARVIPGAQVVNDSSFANAPLSITVGGMHPATDAAFPAASLDAIFTQGTKTYPFYALAHPGGLANNHADFVQVLGSSGLKFTLVTGGTSATAALGPNKNNGLRAGTYLFGLAPKTWARATTLSNTTAQRSLIVVIRPA
jgi:hypothetical protein